jgi:hypothetical protein
MDQRLLLQQLLEEILGSSYVYFQPPANVLMEYPCIVYKRDVAFAEFSGNQPYIRVKRYQVTVIDRNPDSLIPDRVGSLPMCTHIRFFTKNNLNHDVFNLYFGGANNG